MPASRKPPPGRSLELLTAALETLCATDSNLSIESPARLRDFDTGELREIDVLATYNNGNHKTRIAIECRDKSRAVGVNQVDEYAAKLRSLEVDKGVIVSASGFTQTAVQKAARNKIVLQSVEQSVNFDWLGIAGILEDAVVFKGFGLFAFVLGGPVAVDRVYGRNGKSVTTSDLLTNIGMHVLSCPEEWKRSNAGYSKANFPVNDVEFELVGIKYFTDNGHGKIACASAHARVQFELHRVFTTFGFFVNRTVSGDSDSTDFVTGKVGPRSADSIANIYIASKDAKKVSVVREGGAEDFGRLRSFIRFMTWSDLAPRLKEFGNRHHLNISPNSDGLSVSKFIHDFDDSRRGTPFDGSNHFADLKKEGLSTVTNTA